MVPTQTACFLAMARLRRSWRHKVSLPSLALFTTTRACLANTHLSPPALPDGFERTLGCLLRHGASPSTARLDGVGPLMVAAEFGHVGSVATLLRHGAPVNQATRPDGVTALMAAAESGHCSVTRLLLAAGANPNAAMRNSATPLLFATQGGHAEIEAQLLAAGAVDDDCAADGSGLRRLPLEGVEYE